MDKDGGEGFQKDHGETPELVLELDEERRRTHTEESVADGYTREIKEGRPQWKDVCHRDTKITMK